MQGTANDAFYTTYLNELGSVISGGLYVNHGVAAYIPCTPTVDVNGPNNETPSDPIVAADQYHGTNDPYFNFSCAQPANTVSLYRYYKGAPENDHAYVTSASKGALGAGYQYDRRADSEPVLLRQSLAVGRLSVSKHGVRFASAVR